MRPPGRTVPPTTSVPPPPPPGAEPAAKSVPPPPRTPSVPMSVPPPPGMESAPISVPPPPGAAQPSVSTPPQPPIEGALGAALAVEADEAPTMSTPDQEVEIPAAAPSAEQLAPAAGLGPAPGFATMAAPEQQQPYPPQHAAPAAEHAGSMGMSPQAPAFEQPGAAEARHAAQMNLPTPEDAVITMPEPVSAAMPSTGAMAPSRVPPVMWAICGGLFVLGLILGTVGGWLLGGSEEPTTPAPTASPSELAPTASATAEAPPPLEPTLLEKVASGDEAAMKQLEDKPPAERTATEALALGRGRAAQKRDEIAKLGQSLEADPALAEDAKILKQLRAHAKDRALGEQVLTIVSNLPGTKGPDLLYDVWFRTRRNSPVAKLAEELLYSKDVRAKASPALAVVLDLKLEKDCTKVQQTVANAEEHGDPRCLIPLGKLVPKVGCGEKKGEDCFPCLGNRAQILDAIAAARKRPMPVF